MKITDIKRQLKNAGRYSVFVDNKYAFSLSDNALLEAKLSLGQELTPEQVKEYKQLSNDDKLYNQTLRYAVLRPRSEWEIKEYLKRKQASPALTDKILNKLSILEFIDDDKFAKAFVNDRRLLRPASRRKMIAELRKKRVAEEAIDKVLGEDKEADRTALQAIVAQKRQQSRYKDDLKLMQYLARQGFNYEDIKAAVKNSRDS